jgi:hypothetical protein
MKQKKRLSDAENQEMLSANENIYDMFSIEELEQRLQMSEARPWCNIDCTQVCSPICTTVQSCTQDGCSPICGTLCNPVVQN